MPGGSGCPVIGFLSQQEKDGTRRKSVHQGNQGRKTTTKRQGKKGIEGKLQYFGLIPFKKKEILLE